MAIINTPIPDLNSNQTTDQKVTELLNNYYMLRKEIEYAMQSISFENLSATLKKAVESEPDLSDIIDTDTGKIIAENIVGIINTAIAAVQNSEGTVTFDNRGLIVHDLELEIDSTKAVKISSGGILISNTKDETGAWIWRTAITGDSISADAITAGTLTAISINGVTITGSTITSIGTNSRVQLSNGNLKIYDTTGEIDEILLSTEDGHLIMKGYLQTGTEVGATFVDNTGIYFRNETGYGSEIKGGISLSLSSDTNINIDAGLSISIDALSSISLSAISVSINNLNASKINGRSCSWVGFNSLDNFDSVLTSSF